MAVCTEVQALLDALDARLDALEALNLGTMASSAVRGPGLTRITPGSRSWTRTASISP